MIKMILLIIVCTTLISCGGGDDSSSSGGSRSTGSNAYSGNSVTLQAEDAAVAAPASGNLILSEPLAAPAVANLDQSGDTTTCTIIADNYTTPAACISPTRVQGQLGSVHFNGLARLLGADENQSNEGEILGSESFDLFCPVSLATNNTLRDEYDSRRQYDSITLDANYYHIQFPINFNNGETTKWVTMHLAKYGQPFATSDAVANAIDSCGLAAEDATRSNFLAVNALDNMSFKRGDYLFCVKDNQSDECAGSDYQWVDTQTNTLVSSRPASPRQSHWLAHSPVSCSVDGGHVGFNFGPFGLFAAIETQSAFKLWADYSHGDISRQWPNERDPFAESTIADDPEIAWVEPFLFYYHKACPNGDCSNVITTGTALDITLNFDTTHMIFVENMSEENILAETDLATILAKVHTVTQWGFDKKSEDSIVGYDVIDLSTMSVTPSISLNNGTSAPEQAIVYCSQLNPDNADADGCAGIR